MAAKVRTLYITTDLAGRLMVSVTRGSREGRFFHPSPASLARLDRIVRGLKVTYVALEMTRIGLILAVDALQPSPQPAVKGRGGKERIVGIFPGKPGRA